MIDPRTAWKSLNNRFYCSEFCADSEISAPVERSAQKEIHDRQYLDRLRRLLLLKIEPSQSIIHRHQLNENNRGRARALQCRRKN